MQASMSEVVLPLDGRDDEVHHSTEMDQIGSSCRDESQLSSQIDDETLEDVDIVIDHALVQYFGTTLPSVTQNEHQSSPPPRITRDDVPVEQELSKTSEPKRFSIDSVEPNLVSIDRYGSTIDSNWDETETDFNYYLPSYAQEVVITTETNSPQAPDKDPSERLVTAPNDYSLDVIVPEKLGVQGFPFEEALNPLTSTPNPNPLQEEFFDDMDLNPAGLKDCRSFYEAQTSELSAEGSPENVSPGCSSMHIVPMSDGILEVATPSPPEELVGSVRLGVVGKNVIVERNPTASPDVARVPCSNPVCQPLSPPPSYRQTMAAAYQKTVYDPLACCGPYGNVVKNKIVLSYSGEGIMSENDSRDSDYGPPKLDAIDESHTSTNDQPNDFPPMLEPADPAFSSAGKVAAHVIPSAAGEALESIKKLSLGVVPENGQEILEGNSQDELNECLGKLVPSITPEFSKEIPSGYIVNDMYNVRNITPESSTIATCVDDVGSLPDLLPVTEEPKLYRTFNRANAKKKKPESPENPGSCCSQTKSFEKVGLPLLAPANNFQGSYNLPESSTKLLVQNSNKAQPSNESKVNIAKKGPSASAAPVEKMGPITRVVKVAKPIPQQTLSALMHDDGTGRANFKIIPTTATTINLGVKKLTIVKPQSMKDKIVLLKPATVKKILASDFESVSNLKKLTCVQSSNLEKMLLSQASLDTKCLIKPIELESLPTSSKLSNSIIFKEPKDDSNPSTVKGMSKVAVSKSAVALKVSLPLDLLSVKPSVIPDAAKKVACNKDDAPIEKAVTADGEVDPSAIMNAMKVSVPYLFPVTKPEVKKSIKPDVGKMEQPPNSVQEKKKSAAPPVVVKMTSKANRKIFSPIRDVEFPLEKSVSPKKPDNSLGKTNTPNMNLGLTGNVGNLVLCQQQSASDLIIDSANVPSNEKTKLKKNSNTTSEEAAVQSVSSDSKKKTLEPSLMKQVENASDDLSSFLSSLSGPKERPKGVENLEKVVHETIVAASACIEGAKPVTATHADPADDPIIIPPSAFRNDDPLSLKVGLKPCKFRDLKNDELRKKLTISQTTRPVPSSSRSIPLPTNKPTAVAQREKLITKKSIESQPAAIPASENHIVPLAESTFENEKDSQIETEEKVHPIVELINQLIESNSKSPQIFSEPDKTRSEESQMTKKGDEAKAVEGKVEPQEAFATLKNEENRAKEDGILAGVVKERTSKLIKKARDLVSGVPVPRSDDKNRSTENSRISEKSGRYSKMTVLEKMSGQTRAKSDECSCTAKSVDSKDIKAIGGPLKKLDLPQKATGTDEGIEQPGGLMLDKTHSDLLLEKTDAPISSNVATDGAKAQKIGESKSPPLVLPEKNLPSESGLLMKVKASTRNEMPSNHQNFTNVSIPEGEPPKEFKTVKTKDLTCSRTIDSSESMPPLAGERLKKQKQAIAEEGLTNPLQTADDPVTTGKTSKELKGNDRKDCKSSPKTTDLPKKASTSSGKQLNLMKAPIVVEPSTDKSQITTDIPISSSKKLEELKEKTEEVVKRPNKLQTATDVLAGKVLGESKVNMVKGSNISSETTDLSKKTPSLPSTDKSDQPSELLTEEPVNNQLQLTGVVSDCKTSEDLRSKKAKDSESSPDTNYFSEKAPSGTAKPPSKPKVLTADERQPPPKTDSSVSADGFSKKASSSTGKPPSKPKVLTADGGQPPPKTNSNVSTDNFSKKASSNTAKPPSKLKVLTADESQPPTKAGSRVSADETPKELKGKKEEGTEGTPNPVGSSKKATSSSEKLPTQLIVSIPTVAISDQPHTSDLVSANGTSEELKGEKGKSAKHSLHTIDSSNKTPVPETKCEQKTIINNCEKGKSAKRSLQTIESTKKIPSSIDEPPKQRKVSVSEASCEQKVIIVGVPLSAGRPSEESNGEKTTHIKGSSINLSEKVPLVKDSLLKQQLAPAVDRRTLTRSKSKSGVPILSSDESKGEEVNDGNEPSEKVGLLEKLIRCGDRPAEELIGPNSTEKGNLLPLKQDTPSSLSVLQNTKDEQAEDLEGTMEKVALPQYDEHILEKPVMPPKIPEKIGHRMRTRGSVPAPTTCGKEDVKVEGSQETDEITETVVSLGDDSLKEDTVLKQSTIPMTDKSSKRPRTRSETSNEKKMLDEGCTEKLEPGTPVADDEPDRQNVKSSIKKCHGESVAARSVSPSTASAPSSRKVTEQKQDTSDMPTANVRTRGKIERKPATVKPIPATPKKGCSKFAGNSKVLESSLLDDFGELYDFPSPSNVESKESADVGENNSEKRWNDNKTSLKTPVSTRRSGSHKNNVLGSTETTPYGNSDTGKPLSSVRKSNSNGASLCQDPKQLLPKKNLRASMKPKKFSKLKNDMKNLANDVYDFTDDEDQSIKIQTIDHYRKVSSKSTKNIKKSLSNFETSQESLLSDDENKINTQARIGRHETLKIIPGKAKRRASPRKSASEPRKSESRKGAENPLKNVTSESTESLLTTSSETVLPAELQENLRNSRNESIRLAKQNRLKKSPVRNLTTSADAEEARSPKPSSTRETRRSSGSRTSSVENLNIADRKDRKDLGNVIGSGSRSLIAKEEAKPAIEILTRETRRSSGSLSTCGDNQVTVADKKHTGKKEVVKEVSCDRIRKRSPSKKDSNVADKVSREKISADSTEVMKSQDLVSVNSASEILLRPDGESECQISTRSKSRDSINEDDALSPRALRNKGTLQPISLVPSELKLLKHVGARSVNSEDVHISRLKINRNDHDVQLSDSSKLCSSNIEPPDSIESLSKEAGDTVVDQASSNRMITRSSGVPSSKTTENDAPENGVLKSSSVSNEGAFLPKLRSSVNKRLEVFCKTDREVMEVQCPTKSMVHANEKINEVLSNRLESVSRVMAPDKLKKIKKADCVMFASSKDGRFPVDHILEGVAKPVTIATGDTAGKEKQKRAKKGGMAAGVNDMILSQSPLLPTQDVASRNAEAVSLKTPPMDSTATQELDNIQPVGAMSQHGEPEGAKSSTRTAQLRSLVVPLDEDGRSASNSIGFLRKKNNKLIVEKKKFPQSPEMSGDKPIDEEVIARKANDAIIKSSNKRSSVNFLVPPVKFESRRTHVDSEVVSKPGFSLGGSSSYESKTGETSQSSKDTDDGYSNQELKSTRRITRSSLSTTSPNLDLKTPRSSKGEQERVSLESNYLNSSSPDLSHVETEPCGSKDKKLYYSKEGSKPISSKNNPSDTVKEKLSQSDVKSSTENTVGATECAPQIPVVTPSLKKPLGAEEDEAPRNDLNRKEASKTCRPTRGRKSKADLKHSEQPLEKDEMKFAQPKPLKSGKENGALVEIITPGPPSGEMLSPSGRNMTQGKSTTSSKKAVLSKSTSYCMLPKVGRVKTNTKDVCEISGEAEKLFEEASLDGKEGFDVIVPSPGKSPDSTTQNSSEIIIPLLSPELELPNVKISEDIHGVTSTTELGNVLSNTDRKMLILSQDFEACTKKEDESVSSTTIDSTKILETNEVESSLDHLISSKGDTLLSKPVTVDDVRTSRVSNLKIMTKLPKFSGEAVNLIPEHPKKTWRANPVLNVLSASDETTSKPIVGSLEDEVCSIVKPHISDEELKKTPLKKRQVWAYSSSCNSNDDVKNKLVCKGLPPVEGDPFVTRSTIDASPSSGSPNSLPVVVGSSTISPEKEISKISSEIVCTGKADGTCSPTSLVDRLPHSICNILAAPTDKIVTNETTVEAPPQGAESCEPGLNKTNKEKLLAQYTRIKSKLPNVIKRKINKKSRACMSLRSTKNRLTRMRHIVTRNRQVKVTKKRCKVVQKPLTNRKKLKLSPSPKVLPSDKNLVVEDVNQIRSGEVKISQGLSEKIIEEAHYSEVNNVDIKTISTGPSKNHCNVELNGPAFTPSILKPTTALEPAKQPVEVPSPSSKDKYAELTVDTTDKEIDDEESPPFSPIGVDTTNHGDWNSPSNGTSVESNVPIERNSRAQLPSNLSAGLSDTSSEVANYRRSHKVERMRSYSNDEPKRSNSHSSKARLRRKSDPIENIAVDLSNHVKPVFGMKIPPNMPKLDLTGRTPIYHEALNQPPVPYDLIPTTHVRPIPTPPPSYVPPHCPLVVQSRGPIKGNGPIRPIPTLRVPSPVAPYAPITRQFTPDDMRIELSSRMNASYSLSAFHSTKKKSSNFAGPKKVDYNPLLFAHDNNYILNAGLSNVMPSLPATSTYVNSPSSLMKPTKSRSGRGRTDSTSSSVTPSTSKSGVVRSALPDSTESTPRDLRLHEAQVQLLITNPELSISRAASGGNGNFLTRGNVGGSEVDHLDAKQCKVPAFNSSPSSGTSSSSSSSSIIEPLDVVTCELDEGTTDSFQSSRINGPDSTISLSTALKQQTSENVLASNDIRNELKKMPASTEPAQHRDEDVNVKPVNEAIIVGDNTSKKKPCEKPPAKAVSTPRRRISILDANKSYKKKSLAAVVNTNSPIEILSVRDTDRNPNPSSVISSDPKEHVPDSKSTKTIEKSDMVLPTASKHPATSTKTIKVIRIENKGVESPSLDVLPSDKLGITSLGQSSNDVEAKLLGLVNKREPDSSVKPGGNFSAKRPDCTKETKEPLLVVDGPGISSSSITESSHTISCEGDKISASLKPVHVLLTKTKVIDGLETQKKNSVSGTESTSDQPKTAVPLKYDVTGPETAKSRVEGIVISIKEQKKVKPTATELGNNYKPKKVITEQVISHRCTDSITEFKTDKFTPAQSEPRTDNIKKPNSQPVTNGKLNETINEGRAEVVEKSTAEPKTEKSSHAPTELKTDEVSKPSSESMAEGKLNEANIEQRAKAVEKSIPQPKTDASKFGDAHAKLIPGLVLKPSTGTITDGKLNKASIGQTPGMVEKSIHKPKTDTSKLTHAHTHLKTYELSKPSSDPIIGDRLSEASVGPKDRVVEKTIPIPETDAKKFTGAHIQLVTDEVSKPSSGPITDDKHKKAYIEPQAEVVETFIPEPKPEFAKFTQSNLKLRNDNVTKPNSNPRTDELNKVDIKPRAEAVEEAIPKPKTDEKYNIANGELTAQVVGRSIPGFKTDDKPNESDFEPRAEVAEKRITESSNDECSAANILTESTEAIKEPKTNDCLNGVKMNTFPSNAVNEPRLQVETSFTSCVAPSILSGADDRLQKDVTKRMTDESLVILDEQKTADKLETDSINNDDHWTSGCTDSSTIVCRPKFAEEPKVTESVSLRTVTMVTVIEQISDTPVQAEAVNDQEGPLKDDLDFSLPPSRGGKAEKSTGMLQPPKPCPLPPGELLSESTTPVDGKEVTDYLPSKVANILSEVETPTVLVPTDNDALEPPAVKGPLWESSNEFLAVSVLTKTQQVIETKPDLCTGKESIQEVEKEIAFNDEANPNKSRAPEGNSVKPNDPPRAEPSEQMEEARETICSAAVEPVMEMKVEGKIISNCATSVPPEEQKEAKNIDAEHVERENEQKGVSNLVTAHEKDYGKPSSDSIDGNSLEQKVEAAEPDFSPTIDNCSKKEKGGTASGNKIITLVVASSETTKSVPGSAAGGKTKSQDFKVADSPSNEPLSTKKTEEVSLQTTLSCKEDAPEDRVTPSSARLDTHGSDEIKSNITKNNDQTETSLVPGTSALHQLSVIPPDENGNSTEKPDPSSTQEKSPTTPNVSPSSPHRCTKAETEAAQAPINIASPETGNTTSSCGLQQAAGMPNKCSKTSINNVSPEVFLSATDPVVSDLSVEPSPASLLNGKSNDEISSTSSNEGKSYHPKSSHPDHQAVANSDSNTSKPTKNSEEGDSAEIQEASSQTLVVNTAVTVPNFTSKICAIVQSTESSLLLPSDSIRDSGVKGSIPGCEKSFTGSANTSITRPERKRKRPAWWSAEEGTVASKLHKSNAAPPTEKPYEIDCPGEDGEKIKIDPSVPKVEVELLCKSVIRKLQENLGISIDQIDLAKLQKYWVEFHSSFSRDLVVERAQDEKANQSTDATRKSPTERLAASDIHARPSTSQSSDCGATIHSPAARSWMEKDDNDKPRGIVAVLHERNKLAKASHLKPPTKRGEKRTVSQAFAQNVYIYKDPRVTGRSTLERIGGSERRQLTPYDAPLPVLPSRLPTRQSPQISYSWILEHLRERRKKNQHRESNIPVQPCKDFIRPHEEYTRPSLKEVYSNFAEEHAAPMVGYSRVSAVHEVPLPASNPSSTTSRIPTFTISSDSEDSNPGNPEDSVNERDEVRRRIRRKTNTPSISFCSCPQSGHGSNRTTCPSCRKERYHAPGAFSPLRSSRPPLYTEISHVERQESARVRGKRAATVGGGDDPVPDSEAAVRILKNLLATTWPSDLNILNDDPSITRDSFTSYQEDVSPPHVTVSPCQPPLLSSSAHPPPDTERVAGATFQRCLQQKPYCERGRSEDNNDNVQHDSVISTESQMLSLLSQPGTSTGQLRAVFPAMMDNMRAAGSRHSVVGDDPSFRSHGHRSSPSSSSTTDDRGPPKINPSEATKQILVRFLHVLEDLTPEVRDEIKELSRQTTDPPDVPPAKKKKS